MTEPDESFGSGPVIVAVDFSEDSKEAVRWASGEAERQDIPLLVLHVVHDPAESPGFYSSADQEGLRPLGDVAGEMMEAFLAEVRAAAPASRALANAERLLVQGLPPGRIVEVAKDVDARLIVIGSGGRTGLPHVLLGSVAQRVVQLAPMPVVVVKRRQTP